MWLNLQITVKKKGSNLNKNTYGELKKVNEETFFVTE